MPLAILRWRRFLSAETKEVTPEVLTVVEMALGARRDPLRVKTMQC